MKKHFTKKIVVLVLALAACLMLFTGCGKKHVTITFPEDGVNITSVSCEDDVSEMTVDQNSIDLVISHKGTYTLNCTDEKTGDFKVVVTLDKDGFTVDCQGDLDVVVTGD